MAMKQEASYHIAVSVDCPSPESLGVAEVSGEGLLGNLARLLFPYRGSKYPGRIKAVCNLLGIAPGTYAKRSKPSGAGLVSPPLCERAAFVCEARAQELLTLAKAFREQARVKRSSQVTGPKGFLAVKVRDESGIPRTAQGHGRGNGVICQPKKPDPF